MPKEKRAAEGLGATARLGDPVPVPSTYFAALAFIALDRDSSWRLDEHGAGDALAGVAMAISKVHDRMKMPQLVEKMSQHADAIAA